MIVMAVGGPPGHGYFLRDLRSATVVLSNREGHCCLYTHGAQWPFRDGHLVFAAGRGRKVFACFPHLAGDEGESQLQSLDPARKSPTPIRNGTMKRNRNVEPFQNTPQG